MRSTFQSGAVEQVFPSCGKPPREKLSNRVHLRCGETASDHVMELAMEGGLRLAENLFTLGEWIGTWELKSFDHFNLSLWFNH